MGSVWELGELLTTTHPLTKWEFGISFDFDEKGAAVHPLRILMTGNEEFLAIPFGALLAIDWWRGRIQNSLAMPLYKTVARDDLGIRNAVAGYLHRDNTLDLEKMTEPQAPCHPCRAKLLAKPAAWVRAREAVGDVPA